MRFANLATTLLVKPGSALGSKITLGIPHNQLASSIGPQRSLPHQTRHRACGVSGDQTSPTAPIPASPDSSRALFRPFLSAPPRELSPMADRLAAPASFQSRVVFPPAPLLFRLLSTTTPPQSQSPGRRARRFRRLP